MKYLPWKPNKTGYRKSLTLTFKYTDLSRKTAKTTAQQEFELFITSMITDRTGRHEVLLPINHKNYSFRKKKNNQVMKVINGDWNKGCDWLS